MNSWMIWASQLANFLAAPAVSPYDNPAADLARTRGFSWCPQPAGLRERKEWFGG